LPLASQHTPRGPGAVGRIFGRSGLLISVEIGQIGVGSTLPTAKSVVFATAHYVSIHECRDLQEADMAPRILGKVPPWLALRSFATVIGKAAPPRDPDDDETEDEEDDEQNDDLDPAVIREPDE